MKRIKLRVLLIFVGGFFVGIASTFGLRAGLNYFATTDLERSFRETAQFTNPYLECPGFSGVDTKLNQARAEIIDFVEAKEANDDSLQVSVYARDLKNGPWIGVNESQRYVSASLMKVPVMMMLLKQIEEGRLSPNDMLEYQPENLDPNRDINSEAVEAVATMIPGESYSVLDLMTFMTAYSSNEAFFTLLDVTDIDDRNTFEKAVGVDWSALNYPQMVSVKNYSGFFRVLYNASYLNRDTSEFALNLLSQTRFDFGLKAGVPEGTVVANKYGNQEQYQEGDRVIESRNDLTLSRKTKFLHDCGIVYHPESPYALCVMTSSAEKSNIALSEIIAEISSIVYRYR